MPPSPLLKLSCHLVVTLVLLLLAAPAASGAPLLRADVFLNGTPWFTKSGSRGTISGSASRGGLQFEFAHARASAGNLGVHADIDAFWVSPDAMQDRSVSAGAYAYASDLVTITSRTRPIGDSVRIRVSLVNDGAVLAGATPSQWYFSQVLASIETTFTGFGLDLQAKAYEEARCGRLVDEGTCSATRVEPFPLNRRVRAVVGSTYHITHSLMGFAYSYGAYRGSAEAAYYNSSHLYFEALDGDVAVTSESGATYQRPDSVPEPPAGVLGGVAWAALALRRRRLGAARG